MHPLAPREIVDDLENVVIDIQWKDQGWGNRKGELFARLTRNH